MLLAISSSHHTEEPSFSTVDRTLGFRVGCRDNPELDTGGEEVFAVDGAVRVDEGPAR